MARVIGRTPLENYVKDYLKSSNIKYKANFDLLRKAAVYIEQKIAEACCDPETPVINLFTGRDSTFVHTVYTILQGMTRAGHIQSLQRAHDAIINYITPPCCFENSMEWVLTGPTGTVHEATNSYAFLTTAIASGPYSGDITHIDLYLNGVKTSVSLMNPGTYLIAVAIPDDTTLPPVTYYWVAYTDSGTSTQSPSRTYTLENP